MNELQKVRNYVVNKFQSDSLVNTITTLTDDLIDTNKETIYPVVNIDYRSARIETDLNNFTSSIIVSMHIKALDQNDVYTHSTDSKLQSDTNQQDILNETFNICQSFINSFRQYNSDSIELNTVSDILAIKNKNLNDLSGHEFDIVLSIPNEGSSCPQ